MLRGMLEMENEDKILFFSRHFHGRPLTTGGDSLMPLLFSLGQHPALEAVERRLRDNETCSLIWTMLFRVQSKQRCRG